MATEERKLLESWKEISAYLKRGERTCRRWEETLGLPIHRLDGTPRARIFAYSDELDRWLQEKLNHADAEEEAKRAAKSRGRKWLFLLAGAAVLGAAAIAVTLIWHPFSPAPASLAPNPSLAVLPFENQTGDINMGAWRTALPDLVITDLLQSRYVSVVRITDTLRKLVELKLADADRFSDADLRTVAEKLGVDYLATGVLTQARHERTVTVLVRSSKVPGAPRPIRVSFRAEKEIFAAVDALTPQVKQSLGLPGRLVSRDIDRSVSAVSTASPQAFKLFSQGYRLAGLAKYPESIAILQKAIGLDREFALAYKYLFRACQNARRPDDEKAYIHKAMDLSGRLSDRERGELEVLFYRSYKTDADKELASLERLARTYPEDRFASVSLLGYYLNREEWERALPVAERAWPANRSDVNLCSQLAFCYGNLGQWDKAESVLSDFLSRNPGHTYWGNALWLRSHALTRLGKFDEAFADIDRSITDYPNDRSTHNERGILLIYKQDLAGAEGEFRKSLEAKEPSARIEALMLLRDLFLLRGRIGEAAEMIRQALGIVDGAAKDDRRTASAKPGLHMDLAYLDRAAGRPAEALAEVEAARRAYESSPRGTSPPLALLHQRALLLLDLDRANDFELQMEDIRKAIEERRTPGLMRACDHLMGQSAMKKGDHEKAVAWFSKAVDLLPPAGGPQLNGMDPEYCFSLAQAHQAWTKGRYQSRGAFAAYEKVVHPSTNRLHNGDLYARSLYEIARYYEALAGDSGQSAEAIKSNSAKAAEKYREFLALWGGADPIFAPLVEDARKRLAALEGR